MGVKNKKDPENTIVTPVGHSDQLFWCLYIAKNGLAEYRSYGVLMKTRQKHFEVDMRQQIIKDIMTNPQSLLERKSSAMKFTKRKIHDTLSELLMIHEKTSLTCCLALCKIFKIAVWMVDTDRRIFIPINCSSEKKPPHARDDNDDNKKENTLENGENAKEAKQKEEDEEEEDDDDDNNENEIPPPIFIVYQSSSNHQNQNHQNQQNQQQRKKRKTYYAYRIDLSTTKEKMDDIHDRMVPISVVGEHPLRPIAHYKKQDLVDMAAKLPDFPAPLKAEKKHDLYVRLSLALIWFSDN